MFATDTRPTTTTTATTTTATAPGTTERWFDSDKATAAAGLGFTTAVVIQNMIRGRAPQVQASVTEITKYYNDNRAAETVLVALFVFGAFCLARFVGGLWTRLEREPDSVRRPARMGVLGSAGILALFTAMVAGEIALVVGTDKPELAATVAPMWLLHNAIFSVLALFVAIALFGLSRASAAAGLISSKVKAIAAVGATLLAVSTAFAPITVDHFGPLSLVGLIGFIGWLTFLVAVSLRIRRD
jgi:hypothetical protein